MTDGAAAEVVICSVCGVVPRGRGGTRPVCHRCQAGRLIDRALDAGNGATSPALLPLAEMLRATRPETVMRWLSRPQPRALLAELAGGRMPLTHQALHDYPHRNTAEHLRHQLVACGILPAVDAQLVAFEGWIHRRLGECADHPHQRLLRQFGLWHQLSRLRADAATRPLRPTAKVYAVGQFTAAQKFLTWLHDHNIEPGQLRQCDLDTWAVSHTVRERYGAQGFLIWSVESGHLPRRLDIPREKFKIGPAITQQRRLTLLCKYLTDDQQPVAARVAACLLLLYALPVSRILRLTRHDLLDEDGELFLRLGDPPTPVPDPLASLLRQLADASPPQHGWLFPGRNSGQPNHAPRLILQAPQPRLRCQGGPRLRPTTTRPASTCTRHRRRPRRPPHHDHPPSRQRRHDLEPLRPRRPRSVTLTAEDRETRASNAGGGAV